jgi:hypothetical protein
MLVHVELLFCVSEEVCISCSLFCVLVECGSFICWEELYLNTKS